ncbi:MAG: gliding motility-associated C-terminal domain-containing protein, partial [Bacteroidota bacterium]
PDHLDTDSDNDGIPDDEDEEPTVPEEVLPNQGISPNGDGNNDFWVIEGIESHPDNVVAIFNRWGNKVFEIENYDNDTRVWSGESLEGIVAGSDNVPDGVYFYVIEFGDGTSPVSGYVVIKR